MDLSLFDRGGINTTTLEFVTFEIMGGRHFEFWKEFFLFERQFKLIESYVFELKGKNKGNSFCAKLSICCLNYLIFRIFREIRIK